MMIAYQVCLSNDIVSRTSKLYHVVENRIYLQI